jgi:hypothetical protein
MSFLVTKSFVYSSIYALIYSITNFGSMHKEHYLGKFENRAFPSFVTEVLLVLLILYTGSGLQRTQRECHIRDLPYGWHIECIRKQTISKHHVYIVSTT